MSDFKANLAMWQRMSTQPQKVKQQPPKCLPPKQQTIETKKKQIPKQQVFIKNNQQKEQKKETKVTTNQEQNPRMTVKDMAKLFANLPINMPQPAQNNEFRKRKQSYQNKQNQIPTLATNQQPKINKQFINEPKKQQNIVKQNEQQTKNAPPGSIRDKIKNLQTFFTVKAVQRLTVQNATQQSNQPQTKKQQTCLNKQLQKTPQGRTKYLIDAVFGDDKNNNNSATIKSNQYNIEDIMNKDNEEIKFKSQEINLDDNRNTRNQKKRGKNFDSFDDM